jgi:dihydroorotate dehydrogenase
VPLLVKIAPDLDEAALDDIAAVAEAAGFAGIVATNTTLSRPPLHGPHAGEAGGLSGAPLFELSTRVLRQLHARTDLPLIGVGGISTAAQAREKLAAGATALQLYSALIYQGLGLVDEILDGLERGA